MAPPVIAQSISRRHLDSNMGDRGELPAQTGAMAGIICPRKKTAQLDLGAHIIRSGVALKFFDLSATLRR
jgi:hypothetical protein